MRIEEYHRGDVFFADLGSLDLGELYYHKQAGARPVVVVQNDVGCIHSETITSHLGYEIAWCVEAP